MLTPQQKLAVTNRGGKLLVSAAAGSGKTKVLVDRLLSYLTDSNDPANLDDFVIITYTKAAAAELRGKIAAKLTEKIAEDPLNRHLQQQIQRLYLTKISTVHSFCGDILREYAYCLDIPADFRVADENECSQIKTKILESVLENAYETVGENPHFRAFVDSQGFGRDDRRIPEILLRVYASAYCHLDPQGWLSRCESDACVDTLEGAEQTVWGQYLIGDLHAYLDLQIESIQRCVEKAVKADGMEKPAALLADTVNQLVCLRKCDTWDGIFRHKTIDYGRLTFSKKCTDLELAERIKHIRSACKAGLEKKLRYFSDRSEQVLKDLRDSGDAVRGLVELVRMFSDAYSKAKLSRRILDFADLEHRTLDLLVGKRRSGPTRIALELGQQYREIMVDEYQDSNAVQDAIFSALTHKRQNCFMVGDVKQSIYQFRLADPGIFIDKYNRFLHAEEATAGQGRKVLLCNNFRSSNEVICAVNDVFTTCMSPQVGGLHYGDDEKLYEGIPHIPIGEPEVELYGIDVQEDTYAEEAAVVADRITVLLDGTHKVRKGDQLRPITPDDIVILLRSPGSVGGEFRYALEQRGIRCNMGNSSDLLRTEEIGVLRSLLQVISNPLQDIPLIAVLASRVFCFSADELAVIRSKSKKTSIFEALQLDDSEKTLAFLSVLSDLRREARMVNLSQLLDAIFVHTKMDSIYAAMDHGQDRTRNLQAFCQFVADYESTGQRDLRQFLEHLDTMDEQGLTVAGEQKAGGVTIMSIHKSKGLEFPVVFLCGLSRAFNQESAREQVLCEKELGLGLSCVDPVQRVRYPNIAKRAIALKIQTEGISEELRVLYVAMTRARDRLIMTYAVKNLENDLKDLTMRMDMSSQLLLTADVNCPGSWILQSALRRTEAGEFFAISGQPAQVGLQGKPWLIRIAQAPSAQISVQEEFTENEIHDVTIVNRLRNSLGFSYPFLSATKAPSKQTATQLKGRIKDHEAAENSASAGRFVGVFRKPAFISSKHDSTQYGNLIHLVMQHIRYAGCDDVSAVQQELSRMCRLQLITEEQAAMVDCARIARFFTTELGIKLKNCETVLREFKFSILDDAGSYMDGLAGEEVLLQGVVDCAMIDDDGITIIDFKTDHVTKDSLNNRAEQYRTQVMTYANAMCRIYKKPVKQMWLYFFNLNMAYKL